MYYSQSAHGKEHGHDVADHPSVCNFGLGLVNNAQCRENVIMACLRAVYTGEDDPNGVQCAWAAYEQVLVDT